MAFNSNSGTTTVTLVSGSSDPIIDNGTLVVKESVRSNAGTTDTHTVTAGKTFYLCSVQMSIIDPAAGNQEDFEVVTDALGGALRLGHIVRYGVATVGSTECSISFAKPLKIAAGKKIQHIQSSATAGTNVAITGYEV